MAGELILGGWSCRGNSANPVFMGLAEFCRADQLAEAAWNAGGYVQMLGVDGSHDLREALEPHAHEIIDFLTKVWRI